MEIEFVPIDYDYFDFNGRNYIRLIGRTDKGKRICVVDDYEPNFWAILDDGLSEKKVGALISKVEKIKVENGGRESKVEKVELHDKNFIGKKVKALKIFVTNHKDMHAVASELGMKEIVKRREYDISLISKYIIEKKVEPLNWHEVKGDIVASDDFGGISELDVDICIKANKISKLEKQRNFKPRILAYDIEVEDMRLGEGDVLMISLYGENFKKVLTWKHCEKKQDFVECFKDEADMIEGFVKYVKEYGTDVLVGYFSDGFDLPYIRARAQANKIKLDLGLDGKQPVFSRGRIPTGKISGIVHLDLFRFIKTAYSQYLQSETLGLGDIAFELLGEGKLDFDFKKLGKMADKDWREFFEYNMKDSELAYNLTNKIWPDILEFSGIMQEPLFAVSRDSMSAHVENYVLHNLERFNEISEKRPTHEEIGKRRAMGKYEGAFVFQPTPGLYEDIVMFDFTSMYASVIVSYNLSLSTHLKEDKFSKKKGFFPELLEEVIGLRKKYKEEYKKDGSGMTRARSNAYKLLANAAYGYQGFFGARYYCREAAAATAAFAKKNILQVIEKIKKSGFEVVYSDTDSIAFLRGKKTKKDVLGFLEKLNKDLPGIMELDLEDFYKRALFVSKRTTEAGAKKKYALISEDGSFKVRGFETVRRDWCRLARGLQSEVLIKILKDGNEKSALKVLKKVIENIQKRKIDKDDLIIKTQLKKPINEYLSQGPHVVAAKKMDKRGIPVSVGMVIEYFVGETSGKGKRVGDRVFLLDEDVKYDIDYYLNNQILPAVENIFEVFGVNLKEVVEGHRQEKLF
tara:strand:+ start:2621 stop:5023 length:2403 start_codon:yes stop_codon:yes gene_type:complete